MSRNFFSAEPSRARTRSLRSATVLFGVTALVAGLFSGPAAMADPGEPSPPAEVSVSSASPAVNVSHPLINSFDGVTAKPGASVHTDGGQWEHAEHLEFTWEAVNGAVLKTETLPISILSEITIPASLGGGVLKVTVRGINADGVFSAPVSNWVDVEKGDFAVATWDGVIMGKPTVGQKLTVTTVTLIPEGTQTHQWYRGASKISGATTRSYIVTPADVGHQLSVKATASSATLNTRVLTSKSVTVANGTFTAAPAPGIAGTAKVGHKLTANPGNWSPAGATLAYQWYRGSSPISGATGRTYTATSADNGKYVKVRVRASKAGYTTLDRWSVSRKVAAGSIVATKKLSISGSARYGQTLKVSQGWTSGSKVAYQWYRNGKAIKGATKSSLYMNSGYVGAKMTVRVTVSKAGYTTRKATSPAVTVGKASMTAKANPKISGTKKAGYKLTASNGAFSPKPSSHTYQWYRNGKAISGAKYRTYKLTTADSGKKITVKVTARKTGYHNRAATSGAATIYAPPRTVLSKEGTFRVGSDIKPGLYKATGTGSSCYWKTTSGFSGSFSQINNNYFGSARTYVRITSADRGFETRGCGKWTTVPNTGSNASKITKDGTYRVGVDIRGGLYRASGSGSSCYWKTMSGFTGDFDELMDNYFGSARTYVEIPSWADGFQVRGCGTLTRIG